MDAKDESGHKGYTLAELLIVVAIIAILVAIVAPLFVGELNNAKEAVKQANIRAVKSVAISEIMSEPDLYLLTGDSVGWYVSASIDSDGTIAVTFLTQSNLKDFTDSYYDYDGVTYVVMAIRPTEMPDHSD